MPSSPPWTQTGHNLIPVPGPASSDTDRPSALYLCHALHPQTYQVQRLLPVPKHTFLNNERPIPPSWPWSCLLRYRQIQCLIAGPRLAPSETDRHSTSCLGLFPTPQAVLTNPVPHTFASLPLGTLTGLVVHTWASLIFSASAPRHTKAYYLHCAFSCYVVDSTLYHKKPQNSIHIFQLFIDHLPHS